MWCGGTTDENFVEQASFLLVALCSHVKMVRGVD